jgi:hypothetical protein
MIGAAATMDKEHHGGCLCGAVRYRAIGPLRDVIFCHCSQCRKQTGLYYAATAVDKDRLQIADETHLRWYAASDYALRGFCGTCGSALFWRAHAAGHVAILAGSLDDASVLKAASHICTEGRPEFYGLNDGLPAYPQAAPGVDIA